MGQETAEDENEWGDDEAEWNNVDVATFRELTIRLLEATSSTLRRTPAIRRPSRRTQQQQQQPEQKIENTHSKPSALQRWGIADDKNVQMLADHIEAAFGMVELKTAWWAERGVVRLVAEYALDFLPRFARLPKEVKGLPIGELVYEAVFGKAAASAELIYERLQVGSCGWFERHPHRGAAGAFGHFIVVWKHPSPRIRILGVVFPHISEHESCLWGADLLGFTASESAARAVEGRWCRCGVHAGRYFMGLHQGGCPVRAEYRRQARTLLSSPEIKTRPTDGFYEVHYLRFPMRRWVQGHIDHFTRNVAIIHTARQQACRFVVHSDSKNEKKDGGDVQNTALSEVLAGDGGADGVGLFDILPERLRTAPFSASREDLAAIGADRPSPRSRNFVPRSARSSHLVGRKRRR